MGATFWLFPAIKMNLDIQNHSKMGKMNIIMLTSNMVNQGTYWRTFEFAKRLVDIGHDVTIIATSPKNKNKISVIKQDGITLVLMPDLFKGPLRSGWDPYNTLMRINYIKSQRYNFQIVHAFESRPTVIYPSLIMQKKGAKLVMDWCDWFGRGGSVEERPNPIIRTLLRPFETYYEEHFRSRALATTVICTTLRNRAIYLGVKENTITIIPNGLNNSNIKYIDKFEARRRLKLDRNLFIVGYIGSIFLQDVKFMAESCDQITKYITNVKFVHIGYTNYPLLKFVSNPDTVIQTGAIPQNILYDYLAACDLCWLPFKNTNANKGRFPYKLSDYLSLGKSIVATNVGDLAEFIKRENVGVVSQDNPLDFSQKTIDLLLDNNKREWYEKQVAVISRDPKYSWEERSRQLEKIYKELI